MVILIRILKSRDVSWLIEQPQWTYFFKYPAMDTGAKADTQKLHQFAEWCTGRGDLEKNRD